MITLYQFRPVWGLPNASPFCMKVETYLRMAGLPYRTVSTLDLQRAPKGKLPFIRDGDHTVADSGFIIDYLKQRYGDSLDTGLGPAERAVALALQRLLEEHLYWCALYDRWVPEEHWRLTRAAFFGGLPVALRALVPQLARRTIRREIHDHGIGRHSRDEIDSLGIGDVTAVADFLADKPFLLGSRPHSIDAVGYAFLANLLWVPIDSPITRHARLCENLAAYCGRMRERYYA